MITATEEIVDVVFAVVGGVYYFGHFVAVDVTVAAAIDAMITAIDEIIKLNLIKKPGPFLKIGPGFFV
ncbi:MAG: hypothetical protein ACRCS6_12110 [Turicibacter sp.]